ncbi:Very-long-chain 3-oxoacyl-CoA reductase 1 [Cytospora mali]|uniref:Very-long-chain 3-oxoacyl-CoA reductase 1 n=1 Tax=Cytospora mali TaxID=578113 RepID=A0A194W811_CYTMA|nr:Very-long-chain 3-oxoacyl-CoA reductase 1 [Valsa mali]
MACVELSNAMNGRWAGIQSTILYISAFIGGFILVSTLEHVRQFAIFHFSTPSKPLQKYRRSGNEPTYALITGGNGGIGYGIALSLVQHGFGVILLGRNGERLSAAATSLREAIALSTAEDAARGMVMSSADRDRYVKTIILDPQTATPDQIADSVRESIVKPNLDVSILVNNVGSVPIAHPPYRELVTYTAADIDNVINLNARFMAHLTINMLPILGRMPAQRPLNIALNRGRPSLILNVSSGAKIGLPYQIMYSSTKAFTSAFSVGLSRELKTSSESNHIDVLAIVAGDVESQSNIAGLLKWSPNSETYGRYIVEKTDAAIVRGLKEMEPYWLHRLNSVSLGFTPERFVDKGTLDIMMMKMKAMNEATKPKVN